jgi:methylated-DNA-[protein]-cysteine S-methyltransferase
MTATLYDIVGSPIGELLLVGDGESLTGLAFHPANARPGWRLEPTAFSGVKDQLDAYFAGELRTFDLPLAPAGTPFQRHVWDALTTIPYGETTSYGELAEVIGRPGSARAVGAANGRNPIAIVVPCHRVIGADRTLTGYAGGLDAKLTLLTLEGAVPA